MNEEKKPRVGVVPGFSLLPTGFENAAPEITEDYWHRRKIIFEQAGVVDPTPREKYNARTGIKQ